MGEVVKLSPPLALRPGEIIPGWLWRTNREGDISPVHMETRHLFYTLRMIWNHTMPTSMRVGKEIRLYRFGARHSRQYMREAIVQIGAELFKRDDIAPWMREELDEMAAWLRDVPAARFIGDTRALTFAKGKSNV